jgi:hypothetical protein
MDRSIRSEFLPPDDYIEKVKMCQATFSWLVLPDSKCFGPAPAQPNLLPPPSDSSFDHPLPDYAVLNNETNPANNSGPTPNQTVDRSLVVDTYRSAQQPKETWDSFCARMTESLERRKALESEKERQSREDFRGKRSSERVLEEDHGFLLGRR